MANINLAQDNAAQEPRLISKGMAMVLIVFFAIILAYGIVLLLDMRVKSEVVQMKAQYAEAYEKMRRGEASEVADFNNRMNISQKILAEGLNTSEILSAVEKSMIPAVYLDSYSYDSDGSSVTLGCVGDNYNTAAKQILNFKNSDFFAGVTAGETELDEETNKINFTIILKLK